MTQKTNRSINAFHDSRFDFATKRSNEFVERELGLPHAHALGKVAIIHEEDAARVLPQFGIPETQAGGYDSSTHEAFVLAKPSLEDPLGASQSLVSKTIHELVHSATTEPWEESEHGFWKEGIAGMGEAFYFAYLEKQGKRRRMGDTVLQSVASGERLWVPGGFRYTDTPEEGKGAGSSQGLMAASALAATQPRSGIKGRDILQASRPGDRSHYEAMKKSFDALKPGLSKEIERFPSTTEGILHATMTVQKEAGKQGILPPIRR